MLEHTLVPTSPDGTQPPEAALVSPRRWAWRPKLRWFAAEYLIVVLGVVIGFQVTSWGQDRTDRERA